MSAKTQSPKSRGQAAGSPPTVYSFKDSDGKMPIGHDGKLRWSRSKATAHQYAISFAAVAIITLERQANGQYAITAEEPTVLVNAQVSDR